MNRAPNFTKWHKALRALSVLITVGLSGCGLQSLTEPAANPIIQDDVKLNEVPYEITSLTPVRRVIVFEDADGGQSTQYCAESPTDAGENISSTATASLAAQLEGGAQIGADAARQLATALQVINKKTQGIMYYEKVSYRLCEAMMNGRIERADYHIALVQAHKDAVELIKEELRNGFPQADFQSQAPLILSLDESEQRRLLGEYMRSLLPSEQDTNEPAEGDENEG